ncbi:hypothetical protein K6U51_12705 [Vibrio fluvialis]|uniref:metal-dependent hydrolase n=1 Tax=Vibrio fluvialis TaxID=676 RepID=UPI001EEAEE3D|nr:metal-dependent hydrolase [Vibrio fluvialis]MCG6387548.1 hypothetical protein [Vibrio fluvialis]MCG6418892.1 hypothetical protein [Vibrio fluvialis]
MNRLGHVAGAVSFSPVTLTPLWPDAPILSAIACAGLIVGSNAPDWLEFGIIPHRTITHILLIWLSVALYGLLSLSGSSMLDAIEVQATSKEIGAFLWGLGGGAISHWLGDVMNMRAVPIVTPFDKIALRMFNSGEHQAFTCLFIFLVSLALTRLF